MVSINTETDFHFFRYASLSSSWSTYAEPGVKGNTATNATTKATVETGASKRSLFINEGDKIKIDTASGSYMERVKE
jgi:elongation factor P